MPIVNRPPRRTYPGNPVRITWRFVDEANTPVAVNEAIFRIKPPNAPVEVFQGSSVIQISPSEYEIVYTPAVGGLFHCRVESINPDSADEISFRVRPSNVI